MKPQRHHGYKVHEEISTLRVLCESRCALCVKLMPLQPFAETLTFVQNQSVAVLLYNTFLRIYELAITIAALFNDKARLWKEGRKNIFIRLEEKISGAQPVIWMHCASLGEFEQGRPVLEGLRKNYPNHKILLTFFSPSGYEIRKNYNGADWVFYLPLDTSGNVKRFLYIVKPSLAIFVKYEYWYNYLNELSKRKIPTILISAIFRKDKIFFKWYGNLHRKMLSFFNQIFVQDEESGKLLVEILPKDKFKIAGDTRFDRVAEIAAGFQPIEQIEKFVKDRKILIAGSTWPEDEKNLKLVSDKFINKLFLIIAPHEISDNHINFLKRLFPDSILYSELGKREIHESSSDIIIINNIGMLSRLYNYASICYIGGGFNNSGIHNTLEAAVYGKPVIFGPNYQKFSEAIGLIENKGGFTYSVESELVAIIDNILKNESGRIKSGANAAEYVKNKTGATKVILDWLRRISF